MVYKTLYKKLVRPVLFKIDPERVHDWAIISGTLAGKCYLTKKILGLLFSYQNKILRQEIKGVKFTNPVGLAAGFDKDVNLMRILPKIGFGHEEIGTITALPCKGNPKPRLWRLPKHKSIVVYYGLKNPGCQAVAKKLYGKKFKFPVGISVGKTNCKETADIDIGIKDYYQTFKLLEPMGDYFTINVSCPNAYGGLPFSSAELLGQLLTKLDKVDTDKPVFIKLPPDMNSQQVDETISVCDQHRVDGFVISNLTKVRDNISEKDLKGIGPGGLSGKPTKNLSNRLISEFYEKAGDRYVIIGCGGIFSAKDAYEKIKAGASLVQLITGMIYEGPSLIKEINKGLVGLLKKDGFSNISEAVGAGHRKISDKE